MASRQLTTMLLLGTCAAHQTCDEAFPFLGPALNTSRTPLAQKLSAAAVQAGAPDKTLVDLLRPETISWWMYTLNTLSNTVPCVVPWSCREDFLATWDPDLFDWNGGCT